MKYSKQDEDKLKRLTQERNHTFSQMLKEFNYRFTRSALIAKASRMGLLNAKKMRGLKTELKARFRTQIIKRCQWPIGDPRVRDFSFCGDDVSPAKHSSNGTFNYSYCQAHSAIAYRNYNDKPNEG